MASHHRSCAGYHAVLHIDRDGQWSNRSDKKTLAWLTSVCRDGRWQKPSDACFFSRQETTRGNVGFVQYPAYDIRQIRTSAIDRKSNASDYNAAKKSSQWRRYTPCLIKRPALSLSTLSRSPNIDKFLNLLTDFADSYKQFNKKFLFFNAQIKVSIKNNIQSKNYGRYYVKLSYDKIGLLVQTLGETA